MRKHTDPFTRMQGKFIKKENGCLEWIGSLSNGYAEMYAYGKPKRVSRLVLAKKLKRDLLPTEDACHTCDNRKCINADHLFAGTRKENMADAKLKNRTLSGEKNHFMKLRNYQIPEIRKFLKAGRRVVEIAKEFGVNFSTIYRIKRGESRAQN